ncbi:hypothetical protein BN946_scf184804.g1 [Trametes cinnabarina]|uniref:ClpP/crotonase n=1 Tax=Pycnoporus cinnabarinus TaxID=5643 RepID=A0A060SF58_PYCCI|nr:hypothetical protein BN946_scf184804.g1 [Trametes cinnabarina]
MSYSYPLSLPSDNPLVTVTHPTSTLWVIELHNGADSRLTDVLLLRGIIPALDTVEKHWRENWRAGKAKKDEGLCKGLDYDNAIKDPSFGTNFFPSMHRLTYPIYNPMIERLLALPIPTIAAVNGHAFAGGMALAMACDYRVMTDGSKRNAWISMNEIQFGATLPLSLAAILKAKAPNPQILRKIILEGHRFTPKEALEVGLVDRIIPGTTEDIIAEAQSLADSLSTLPTQGAWGLNRIVIIGDVLCRSSSGLMFDFPIYAISRASNFLGPVAYECILAGQ